MARVSNALLQVSLHPGGGAGGSHDAVGKVLEAVVELGGQRPHGSVHQLVHQQLQLLLRQRHVEALLQAAHGTAAVEAGQLGAWRGGGGSGVSAD